MLSVAYARHVMLGKRFKACGAQFGTDLHRLRFSESTPNSLSRLPAHSAVVGSMMVMICEILLAGNPPLVACSRTAASLGAMYTQ